MSRTSKRDRQSRLNFVELSDSDLDAARRLLTLLAANDVFEQAVKRTPEGSDDLRQRARQILAQRKRRTMKFGCAMFGEPAWEILLWLYALDAEARQSLGRLSELSLSSRSTAVRWIGYLERNQWVEREPHPTDRRSSFIKLTDDGRSMLEDYLSEAPVARE